MAKRMSDDDVSVTEADDEAIDEEIVEEFVDEDDLDDKVDADEEESEDDDDDEEAEEAEEEEEEEEEDDDDEEEELQFPIFEEEPGYRDTFDWGALAEEDLERHRSLLTASEEDLGSVNFKKLDPLDRWAVAQSYARLGMRDAFQDVCRKILKARKKHDALMYEDIYLELISDLADSEAFDEAFSFLEKFAKAFPDEAEIVLRVRGLLLIESGEEKEGKGILDELMSKADDNGELHLELGDDLLAMGHARLALSILARGKDFARRQRDTELMTAIDETRRLALTRLEAEDA